MARPPPSLQRTRGDTSTPRWPFLDTLLTALVAAHKAGTLDELLQRRPRSTRWLAQRLLPPVLAVAGDAVSADPLDSGAWRLLLRATLARLRPDGGTGLHDIDASAWLTRTPWRPLLALACHGGFIPVAVFPQAYRARPDESAAEQLCGLWDVGASTFYRHLDKGRRQLGDALIEGPPAGPRGLAWAAAVRHEVHQLLGLQDAAAQAAWHTRQAGLARAARDGRSALWHLLSAGDADGFVRALQGLQVELASDPEVDALVAEFVSRPWPWRVQFQLQLAWAGPLRVRGWQAAEQQAFEAALQLAHSAGDALSLGIVYGALGKFYELRDADRAFACYQQSADFLQQAGADAGPAAGAEVGAATLETLVKLAWLYALRNDPRCKTLLDRAEALRGHGAAAPAVLGMLEQTWGEYWRRSGDLRQALECKHRALLIYERLGDRQAILKTHGNLALIYGDAKDFTRAIDHSRCVLEIAERYTVEPEIMASTQLNLGAAYFWQGKYDAAIEQYQRALAIAQQSRLSVLGGRAHYNLAEAYYKRFQALDRPEDERRGDAHSAAALATWPEGDAAAAQATRSLKSEILGPRDAAFVDRLLPGEFAAHFDAMSEVQRQRAALALPLAPADRVGAHLAIAAAYLDIVMKERDAALALVERHGLGDGLAAGLARLQARFAADPGAEALQDAAWQRATEGLLQAAQRSALRSHLQQQGSVNKSGYALACGVGLATASKHLGLLAERGLLVQTGKGPSTRYLPAGTATP